jgi:AcrR family transcriptional regulator
MEKKMDYTKVPGSATAYRRQKQIEECLFDNLLQRPYPSVSISDLSHQLGISRKSFYNYFPDKDSCFRAIISRKIHTCILRLTTDLPEKATDEEVIAFYLSYWKEEKGLFDIITRNNLLYLLMDQCISFLRDEDQSILPFLDTPQLQADSYVLSAFVSVQVTLILQWYFLNFSTPLEEMVRTYQRIIYQPLIIRDNVPSQKENCL